MLGCWKTIACTLVYSLTQSTLKRTIIAKISLKSLCHQGAFIKQLSNSLSPNLVCKHHHHNHRTHARTHTPFHGVFGFPIHGISTQCFRHWCSCDVIYSSNSYIFNRWVRQTDELHFFPAIHYGRCWCYWIWFIHRHLLRYIFVCELNRSFWLILWPSNWIDSIANLNFLSRIMKTKMRRKNKNKKKSKQTNNRTNERQNQ